MIRVIATLMTHALLAMFIFGCKGEPGTVGPSGTLSGNLYGQVTLSDEDSSRIVDNSGVAVSVQGTDYSTMSGTDGWWRILGLRTGTYTLLFSKPGYGTYKQFGFQFVGGDSLYYGLATLGNIPRYYVTSFAAAVGTDSIVHLTGTVSSAGRPGVPRYVIAFIDTIATVSSSHYLFTLFSNISSNTSFSMNYTERELALYYGTQSGSTIYCVSHGLSNSGGSGYYDPTLRTSIYPTLSTTPSQIVSVKLP